MTKKIKWISIILLTALLISCGKSEQQLKEEKKSEIKQKKEQLKIKNENAIKDLSKKNNAVMDWDTLYVYTYVFQEMFIENNRPLCFEGELKDITKSDSNYTLKVHNTNYTLKVHNTNWHWDQNYIALITVNYIALITVNSQMFFEIIKQLKSHNHSNDGCFVFEVTKIFTANPAIKSDLEFDGEDSYSFSYYDFDETLVIFKGNLIDFYLNETIEKSNE